jgi:hypothetical protein
MRGTEYLLPFGILPLLSIFPACSKSGNDPGTGGGATGGTSGAGGVSGSSTCRWNGKTYAVGETFADDCNTCSCGALGDTQVRCTLMACNVDGGPGLVRDGSLGVGGIVGSGGLAGVAGTVGVSGAGGTGRIARDGGGSGTGGISGAGGSGRVARDGGATQDAAEPAYCAPCLDEAAAKVYTCPAQQPVTKDDLMAVCASRLATAVPTVIVELGDCVPESLIPGCSPAAADPDVLILSVIFSGRGGFDCHYSRATGALVGQATSADSTRYCNYTAFVVTTSGVTNAWCRAGGPTAISVTCTLGIDGGIADTARDASRRQ